MADQNTEHFGDMCAYHSQRGHEYGVHHLLSPVAGDLVKIVAKLLELSSEQVHELIGLGAIYVNHERCAKSLSLSLQQSDYLRVHTKPRRFPVQDIDTRALVVFQNSDFIVINKPAGIPVHPSVDNDQENLLTLICRQFDQEFLITHRLDVPTSGLMIYAKNKSFQKLFNQYLIDSAVLKTYRALVETKKLSDQLRTSVSLVHFMEPSPRAPKKLSAMEQPSWQRCVLHIKQIRSFNEEYSELHIELETGRTHQIRAQLAFEGCPIIGDSSYGSPLVASGKRERIALQSFALAFPGHEQFILGPDWTADLFQKV